MTPGSKNSVGRLVMGSVLVSVRFIIEPSGEMTNAAKQASIFFRTNSASSYSSRSRSFRITGASHVTPRT